MIQVYLQNTVIVARVARIADITSHFIDTG